MDPRVRNEDGLDSARAGYSKGVGMGGPCRSHCNGENGEDEVRRKTFDGPQLRAVGKRFDLNRKCREDVLDCVRAVPERENSAEMHVDSEPCGVTSCYEEY